MKTFEKREYEKAVKRSVSMPTIMFDRAVNRARMLGFTKFSDYIQHLMRKEEQTAAAN